MYDGVDLEDAHWVELRGGYRTIYDPRPVLARLSGSQEVLGAWAELWQELFHQGDIGEASYAAVPELVRIERNRTTPDWNTYALVATIELARDTQPSNPSVPEWLQPSYGNSLASLAEMATARLPSESGVEAVRSMLAMIAISKGARTYALVLVEFSEDEVKELISKAFGN